MVLISFDEASGEPEKRKRNYCKTERGEAWSRRVTLLVKKQLYMLHLTHGWPSEASKNFLTYAFLDCHFTSFYSLTEIWFYRWALNYSFSFKRLGVPLMKSLFLQLSYIWHINSLGTEIFRVRLLKKMAPRPHSSRVTSLQNLRQDGCPTLANPMTSPGQLVLIQ